MPRSSLRGIDREVLSRAADIIKLIGHPERLKILEALEDSDLSVGEICRICALEQAIGSQHLARLRRAKVVAARRHGPHVIYRVIEPKVHHILECIRRCDVRR